MKRVLFHFTIFPLIFFLSFNLFALGGILTADEAEAIEGAQAFFGERTKPEIINKELIHSKRNYNKSLYTIKATNLGEERISKAYYYETKRGPRGPKPTVIIFSSVGGVSYLERGVAYYLAGKGISSFITELDEIETVDTIEKVSPFLLSSLFSSLNIFDFAANHKNVDEKKMATIGISLGGFRALYLSALESRVASATLVVSGASVSETLSTSTLDIVQELRAKHMKALNLDPSEISVYKDLLEKEVQFNVEDLLGNRNTSEYLLFQSKNDTTVPSKLQEDLYQMLGKPERKLRRWFGHVGTAVLFGLRGLSNTVDFMESNWNK